MRGRDPKRMDHPAADGERRRGAGMRLGLGRAMAWAGMTYAAAWLGSGAATALAQGAVCMGSNITYAPGGNDGSNPAQCSGFTCQQPVVTSGPTYQLASGCDPKTTTCGMTVVIGMQFPGNHSNGQYFNFGYSFEEVDLLSNGSLLGECGYAGEELQPDFGTVTVTGSVHCGAASTYTVNLISCPGANCPTCPHGPVPGACMKTTPLTLDLAGHAGCPTPPPEFCSEGGGAGGGAAGPGGGSGGGGATGRGGTGGALAWTGSKGNGPDSGAAGTTGGGQCQSCKSLGSSAGDGSGGGSDGGGSGCGFSVGGGGSSCLFRAAGAHLRYGAGGVGGTGFPGSTGITTNPWNTTLGRYWSHDWAERIVMDPDESHVWLLTRFGSFREFGSLAAGSGLRPYQTVTPGDEYRKLYYDATGQGWQLKGLDGSIEYFLPKTAGSPAGMLAGFLDKITDRLYDPANPAAHPPVQATYNASNQLDHVTLPDGRRENFSYTGGASGKLASLTEVGTDGVTTRIWGFTWNGDDLTLISRPDTCPGLSVGTSWRLFYSDTNHPGYVTQVLLGDCHNNSRMEAAFGYDAVGNVVMAWRGDPSFSGPNAVDWYQLSFDSPALPAATTVQTLIKRTVVGGVNQDTLQTSTYTLDRDPGRAGARGTRKTRVRQVTGECPSCGTTANPAFAYADPANPLLPTMVTDGRGAATSYFLDANGRQLTKVETVQTTPSLVQRQTTWTYNPSFPSFVSTVTGPFSPPGTPPAGTRAVALTYDPKGNLLTSTIGGSEATYPTGAFSLQTAYGNYSAAGLPGLINPPDVPSTTDDATTYTFLPGATNGYLVATRSDPVTGAPPLNAKTTFQYDAFNRPTDVIDVNGMTTHTAYDALNRMLSVTQGFGSAQPLMTTYNYNSLTDALGDLICVQSPAGNAIAYGYDGAGRVSSISRQASCSATQPLEQTLYTQDAAGHRTSEVRQRIVGGSPVTDATTSYAYSTVCHLDSMTAGDPNTPSLQSTTQFQYDCNNNLISVWDPKHDQPAAPSTSYSYDPLNRLAQVLQPWGGAGGGTAVTTYGYDLQDHLSSVTDSERNQTTYVTSDRDLLTRQTSPVTGVTIYGYNAHGALVQQTDARGVVMTRQLDPADRPRQATYTGDPTLTTTYAYDTTTATGTFPIGRLSSITKGTGSAASVISYTYDLFGRMLQDGAALAYAYDLNGNRTSITYPGNVTACYGYDIADRQASLSYSTATGANVCQGTATPIVTSTPSAPTVYSAAGPLQQLHLANGITETHSFDQRYYPTAITAGTLLSWSYTTDAVGNITAISPGRTFVYQDFQYFLTQANAPTLWGTRTWAYDTVGNRLSEDRGGGAKDTYTYQLNAANPQGDMPLLETISLANSAGTKYFIFDRAGNEILEASPTSHLELLPDAAGKLSRMTEGTQRTSTSLAYDGRGFLAKAHGSVTDCGPLVTSATYSSDGVLYHRQRQALFTAAIQAQTRIFYFAGRPVAQLDGSPATGTLTYLTVDHLGTPILASTSATVASWSGGFEPFGRDFTSPSAQGSGIFLRLPGQWDDLVWDNSKLSSSQFYNVNRWYEPGTGRYTQADPLGLLAGPDAYVYANASPLQTSDPTGLDTFKCSIKLGGGRNPDDCTGKLCHVYLCVVDSGGNVTCGGQGSDASNFDKILGPVPSTNDFRAFERKRCPLQDRRPCFDNCVIRLIKGSRPDYDIGNANGGLNCQGWASFVLATCTSECSRGGVRR
jgi:RHS repeat-associated protein